LSIPMVERIRFATYVGALSGLIVVVGLTIYFWAHLRELDAAFELLIVFALAIIVFPLAVIFREARRKRRARTT